MAVGVGDNDDADQVDYYQLLGLKREASAIEIRTQYRKLALQVRVLHCKLA